MKPVQPADRPLIEEQGGLRALQFDRGTIQSVMAISHPEVLALDYTRAMMGFLFFCSQPSHIVMIGLGGGSLAKYCLASLPTVRFTAVEINPAVIALRDQFAIPPDDERFRVFCADGARFVHECEDSPDVLLVDGFVGAGLPEDLASADFYAACRRLLSPEGVAVFNHWSGDPRYPLHASRLREAFERQVISIPAEEGDNRISFAFARARRLPTRAEILERAQLLSGMHCFDAGDIARRLLRRLQQLRPAQR